MRFKITLLASIALTVFASPDAQTQTVPNDPLLDFQHQLQNWDKADLLRRSGTGIRSVWLSPTLDARGIGQFVGVVDGGIGGDIDDSDDIEIYIDGSGDWNVRRVGGGAEQPIPNHGTAVTGTIVAHGDNGYGGAGIAYEAKALFASQIPTCVTCPSTSGWVADQIFTQLQDPDGAAMTAHNNSWGQGQASFDSEEFERLRSLVDIISSTGSGTWESDSVSGRGGKGLALTFAVGNESVTAPRNIGMPATMQGFIGVSNADTNGWRDPTTSFGPWVDVAAIGRVLTTVAELEDDGSNGDPCAPGGGASLPEGCDAPLSGEVLYEFRVGTSLSAPVVAGVITLMREANGDLEGPQIRRILQHTARKVNFTPELFNALVLPCVPAPNPNDPDICTPTSRPALLYSPLCGFNDALGYGIVDAPAAITAALNAANKPPIAIPQNEWDGETWPAPPSDLALDQECTEAVTLTWTNASAPASGYHNGEYNQVMVVRFEGNIIDQGTWSRSVDTTVLLMETLPVADDAVSDEMIWKPTDRTEYSINTDIIPGVRPVARGDISSFEDTSVSIDDCYTYAVYTINSRDAYSHPEYVLKRSRKQFSIPWQTVSGTHRTIDLETASPLINPIAVPLAGLDYLGQPYGFQVNTDADGDSKGELFKLFPNSGSFLPTARFRIDVDLTEFTSAALFFDEIVEVWGIGYAEPGDPRAGGLQGQLEQYCELVVNPDSANPFVAIKDHTSITARRDREDLFSGDHRRSTLISSPGK